MTWTFSDVAPSARDRVRIAVGDTDAADPMISDEIIDLALADCGNEWLLAALDVVVYLRSQNAQLVTNTQAGLTENWDQRQKHYADLETAIRALMVRKGLTGVYLGGLTRTGKDLALLDPDRVQPAFVRPDTSRPIWDGYWRTSG